MTFVLRDYQADLIRRCKQAIRDGKTRILLVLPTGGGKTCISGTILGGATQKNNDSWFINHRRELIKQSSLTFSKVGIEHGIVSAGWPMRPNHAVQICGVQSLIKRLEQLQSPKIIVWDETHHVAAGTWAAIFEQYPDAIHIGVTATPIRLDGTGLNQYYETMIVGPTMRELIDQGHLCEYRYYSAPAMDWSSLKTARGDYTVSSQKALLDKQVIIQNNVDQYERICPGARMIVFATSIEHSQHIVQEYRDRGHVAMHLDGTTPTAQRDDALAKFADGEIKVLSNVDLFGEGFDVPAIEAVQLCRRTKSLGLFLQQVGRALRPAPGKPHAYILDQVENYKLHGFPDDHREWTLDGKVKGEAVSAASQCPSCYCTHTPAKRCPACGHVYEAQKRQQKDNEFGVDGVLVEITTEMRKRAEKERAEAAKKKANRELRRAKTLPDLLKLGKERGYTFPEAWAQKILAKRQEFVINKRWA